MPCRIFRIKTYQSAEDRYHSILFALLLFFFVFSDVITVQAGESLKKVPNRDPSKSESLTFTDRTEREDRAAAERFLKNAQSAWLSVYMDGWTGRRMDELLAEAVLESVAQEFSKVSTIEKIKGILSHEAMERMIRVCIYRAHERFDLNYKSMLRSLSGIYAQRASRLMPNYFEELREIRERAAATLPGRKALERITLDPIIAKLSRRYSSDAPPFSLRPDQIGPAGRLSQSGKRRRMKRIIQDRITSEVMKGLLDDSDGDLFSLFTLPLRSLGGGAILEEMLNFGNEIGSLPEKYGTALYQVMRDSYYYSAPRIVWDHALDKQIKEHVEKTHTEVEQSFDKVYLAFRSCESYMSAASRIDDIHHDELLRKTYSLSRLSEAPVCEIGARFGDTVLDVEAECIPTVAKIVKEAGAETAGRWVRIAPKKACVLGRIPAEKIRGSAATGRNLSYLTWLAGLPPAAAPTAGRLDRRTSVWLRLQKREAQLDLLENKAPEDITATMNAARPSFPGASAIANWIDRLRLDYLRVADPFVPWQITWWAVQALLGAAIGLLVCVLISMVSPTKRRQTQ